MSFIFPVDLGRIDYEGGGIGPWGAHMGDHVEGLDHVWIDVLPDTPIVAPASGEVFHVYGEPGRWGIIIKHSERFFTEFYLLDTLLVEVGDHVEQGQPIAYPMKFYTWKETYGFD